MSEHSPIPWIYHGRLSASENHKGYRFGSPAEGWPVGEVFPLDEDGIKGAANAVFIVLSANYHDRLIEALRDTVTRIGHGVIAAAIQERPALAEALTGMVSPETHALLAEIEEVRAAE